MANRRYTQFFYTQHTYPVQLDCNFVVDSANPDGVSSLKGPGIQAVYMHTSATPSANNPNPDAGYILVQLQDNFKRLYGVDAFAASPVTGSELTSGLNVGAPFVISTVGASTLAEWQAAGLPAGITPAIGVAFLAKATSIAGGGKVKAVGVSGIEQVELIGNSNLTINSSAKNVAGVYSGSYLILQTLASGAPAAPTDGSVIYLKMLFSNSRIMVQGE